MFKLADKQLRVIYAAGPGNVIGTYQHWKEGQEDPSQVAITYSSQFFEVCKTLGAKAYVISSFPEAAYLNDGDIQIRHRPSPIQGKAGVFYHLAHLWYGLRLVGSAIKFGADAVVVSNDTTHWFVLILLMLLGIQVVPTIHCCLWKKFSPKKPLDRILLNLAKPLFYRSTVLTVSPDVAEQVQRFTRGRVRAVHNFLPTYRPVMMSQIPASEPPRDPFNVLFVGRIETEKGVYDLLEIAKRFAREGQDDIVFNICGDGSELDSLKAAAAGLADRFLCHGHCTRIKMRQIYSEAHTVVVPTRKSFSEGFNKVVVESVLARRPVITSAVCPAVSVLKGAVVEVDPDDVTAYGDAIVRLRDDLAYYSEIQARMQNVGDRFYNPDNSWATALTQALIGAQRQANVTQPAIAG
jgi:glycogen synthase